MSQRTPYEQLLHRLAEGELPRGYSRAEWRTDLHRLLGLERLRFRHELEDEIRKLRDEDGRVWRGDVIEAIRRVLERR